MIGIAIFLSAVGAVALRPQGSEVSAWWPSAGFAAWLVLRQSSAGRRWTASLTIFFLTFAANMLAGQPWNLSVPFSGANAAEAAVVAAILASPGHGFVLDSFARYARLAVAAASGAVLIAGLAGITVATQGAAPFSAVFASAVPSHLSGSLLILALVCAPPNGKKSSSPTRVILVCALLCASATATFVLTVGEPLAFLPLAAMTLAAFVLTPRTTGWASLLLALIATLGTAQGRGPFAEVSIAPAASAAIVQLFVVCTIACAVPISLAVRDRAIAADGEREARLDQIEFTRMRSALVTSVTHELRTPLTVIIGFTDLLASRLDQDATKDLQTFAATAHRHGLRMSQLVDDLLEANAVEAELAPSSERIDLVDLAREVTTALDAVVLIAPQNTTQAWVAGDREQLRRVVAELATNAIHARTPGSEVLIEVSARAADPELVQLTIANQGDAMSESDLRQAFTPFYRTLAATTEARPGVGLGLAVARRIVTAHGGSIAIRCSGGTTTATVELPRAAGIE